MKYLSSLNSSSASRNTATRKTQDTFSTIREQEMRSKIALLFGLGLVFLENPEPIENKLV